MRNLLRAVAAVQTWTAAAVCGLAGLGAFLFVATGDGRTLVFTALVGSAASVVASVGGILWCLTVLMVPPPAPTAPRAARFGLRVLAQVQLGSGVLIAVGAAVLASDQLLLRPRRGEDGITALVMLFAALGLAGLGAVLWCLVRLAYPDSPAGGATEARPPRRLVGVVGGVVAATTTVTTALAAAGLAWVVVGVEFRRYAGTLAAVTVLAAVAVVVVGLVWCAPLIARPPAVPPGVPAGGGSACSPGCSWRSGFCSRPGPSHTRGSTPGR